VIDGYLAATVPVEPPPAKRGWFTSPPRYVRTEAIWFPYYAVSFDIVVAHDPKTAHVAVEGCSGATAMMPADWDDLTTDSPGESFEPALSPEDARGIAHEALVRMTVGGGRRSRGIDIRQCTQTRCVGYPLLIDYLRRWGRLDIQLRDGRSGAAIGARTKHAVLDAFRKRGTAGHIGQAG